MSIDKRDLVQRGVDPKDIILRFRSPGVRQLFAAHQG